MKLKKVVITTFLAAVLMAGAVRQARSEEINIAWTGETWTSLPFRIAADRGFFDKEGLKAKFITFRGTDLIIKALMLGELDYATVLPSVGAAAARGLPIKIVAAVVRGTGYAIISRPEIVSLKDLRGKKIGISSFGAASDYAVYSLLLKNGFDPNRDVTFLNIGGTSSRFAALIGGTVDATVVSSPFEYKAESQGMRTLVSVKELAVVVKLPNTGIGVTQKKIETEPEQIVRVLRAVRGGISFIQKERGPSTGIFEKMLKLDRPAAEKFYSLYRDQYVPELTVPDEVIEEAVAMSTFRLKEKEKSLAKVQSIRDWSFAEKAK